jgi:branched-chain amino acid transport system ATP-binding protein
MSDKQIRLSVQGVNKRFGGLQALSDVGLRSGKARSTA